MNLKRIVGLTAVAFAMIHYWNYREIERPPGVLIAEDPIQGPVSAGQAPRLVKDSVLDLLATYRVRARVLATERYWMDPGARISPIDVALGWGPASDTQIIEQYKIRQGGRFYFLSWRGEAPLPNSVIQTHSANLHVIPANDYIADEARKLRVGDLVTFSGYLVRANFKDGSDWKSSLTRDDSGNGACELMLVESILKE